MSDGHRVLISCLLVASSIGCGERPRPAPESRRNVLLIVIDTLRADRLGCYGAERDSSPRIDALAAEGRRFERAYSVAPWTMPAVATMFTGLYPRQHGVTRLKNDLPEGHVTLAEAFARAGYHTSAVVSHYLVGERHHLDRGFAHSDEEEAQGHRYLSTPGVVERSIGRLRDAKERDEPFFLFVHLFDPHYNYMRHPTIGYAPARAGRLDGTQNMPEVRDLEPLTPDEGAFLRDLYDEEIRFTDRGVGHLLDALAEMDLAASTLVVLTSDHGEEFLDHGGLGHTRTLFEELIRVPLIVRGAGVATGVDAVPISLVGLAPTLLDWAGLDPAGFSKNETSWVETLEGNEREPRPVYAEVDFEPVAKRFEDAFHKKAVIHGDRKRILDELAGTLMAYDLGRDPSETEPRPSDDRDELTRELLDWIERTAEPVFAETESPVGSEERERLRSLGYVGDGD